MLTGRFMHEEETLEEGEEGGKLSRSLFDTALQGIFDCNHYE
jgi:hypothetical protein